MPPRAPRRHGRDEPRRAPSPWRGGRAPRPRRRSRPRRGRAGPRRPSPAARFFPFGNFDVLLRELAEEVPSRLGRREERDARRDAVGDPFRVDAVTDRFVDAVPSREPVPGRDGRDVRVATVFCVSGGGAARRAARRAVELSEDPIPVRRPRSRPGRAGARCRGPPRRALRVRLRRRDDGVGARARGRRRRAVVAVARAQGQSS